MLLQHIIIWINESLVWWPFTPVTQSTRLGYPSTHTNFEGGGPGAYVGPRRHYRVHYQGLRVHCHGLADRFRLREQPTRSSITHGGAGMAGVAATGHAWIGTRISWTAGEAAPGPLATTEVSNADGGPTLWGPRGPDQSLGAIREKNQDGGPNTPSKEQRIAK